MNPALVISGLVGLLAGTVIYSSAGVAAQRIPILLQGGAGPAIAFATFLLISLAEIPMMLFGLTHMVRSQTTPRWLVIGTFMVFVMFAAVYASVFVLLTGEFAWGLVLTGISLVRFAGGALLK
ncbi:MAG TPA: hypothetical protein VF478_07340 [Anaerolineae bacterium]